MYHCSSPEQSSSFNRIKVKYTLCCLTEQYRNRIPCQQRKFVMWFRLEPRIVERIAIAFLSRQQICGITHNPVSSLIFSAINTESALVLPDGESGKVTTSTSAFLIYAPHLIAFHHLHSMVAPVQLRSVCGQALSHGVP